jgi:dipeptide/tripeptide permease
LKKIKKNKKAKNQLVFSTYLSFFLLFHAFHFFLDTAFKQQRLPAWQPIITADTALPVFLIIGLVFIPIGIVLVVTSERV